MSASLKWANRFRLDLAFEIAQLESGVRRMTQNTPNGPVDVTDQALVVLKDRFEQLEEIVFAQGDKQQDGCVRMQSGNVRDGDRPLRQCLAEVAICAQAIDNFEAAAAPDNGLPPPGEGFV